MTTETEVKIGDRVKVEFEAEVYAVGTKKLILIVGDGDRCDISKKHATITRIAPPAKPLEVGETVLWDNKPHTIAAIGANTICIRDKRDNLGFISPKGITRPDGTPIANP